MNGTSWYSRPVAALCVAAAAAALSLAALVRSEVGRGRARRENSYFVTIRHYGIDAREMERSVALPLEDSFSAIPGAFDVATVSEYGKVRASVRFPSGADSYEAVREAAQFVYERLPPSAQRPEIGSSNESRAPVWVAAVTADGNLDRLMEKAIKPAFERIDGVGEVEVAGSGVPQTRVLVREAAAAALSLDAASVAAFLAANDGLFPSGTVRNANDDYVVSVDARYRTDDELGNALIPAGDKGAVPLDLIARVEAGTRKAEARARVNGDPAAVVSVIPSSNADPAKLSRAFGELAARFPDARFRVLSDRGAEVAASRRSILAAAAQGVAAVAFATALIARGSGARTVAAGALSVPFTLLCAAALLSAAGFPLDRVALAGLAAGIGAAVDAAILAVERLGRARNDADARRLLRSLAPSLSSGGATTLIVLIPLSSMDKIAPGSAALAFAVGSTAVCALFTAVVLLPPLMGRAATPAGGPCRRPREGFLRSSLRSGGRTRPVRFFPRWKRHSAKRAALRILALNAAICARRPLVPLLSAFALTAAALIAAFFAGVDVGTPEEGSSIYAHIEAESGATMESVDERLASWSRAVRALRGVVDVQTSARPGSGSAVVSFDPKRTDRRTLSRELRSLRIPGAFVFLPEAASGERFWKLTVSGDDDRVCRDVAVRIAARLDSAPAIRETVLNFKDGPDRLLLLPDRDKLARSGLEFARAADSLRRSVHGPVAYKRTTIDGESDVRVGGESAEMVAAAEVGNLLALGPAGPIKLASVMDELREKDVGRIMRADRRRTAALTIRTAAMDPRRARALVTSALGDFRPPSLYSLEFDREAIEAARRLSSSAVLLLAALALSYMTLAALAESYGAPLAVLAAVPPSLAVPLIASVVFRGSLNAAAAAAFVAVSGFAVNASVLTVEARRSLGVRLPPSGSLGLYRLTRSRAASLAATCGTTVAGAAPLLLLSDSGNEASRALAFVTVFGSAASFAAALSVVPALAVVAPRLFDTWHLSVESSRLGLHEDNRKSLCTNAVKS